MKKKTSIAGEWVLTDITMDLGEFRYFGTEVDLVRANMDETSIYIAGRFEITDGDGNHVAFREVGDLSAHRPDVPAGSYKMTALEANSRLLCLHPRTRGHLYKSDRVILNKNDSYTIDQGCDVIVAKGSIGWDDKIKNAISMVITESKNLPVVAKDDHTIIVELWR